MTMDRERWLDLVSEMFTLVMEQAALGEVTRAVTDLLGDGREVVHGPWQPDECRAVLEPWHQAGWLDLVADAEPPSGLADAPWRDRAARDGAYLVLDAADARALLAAPARWVAGTADGEVMLCVSDSGSAREYAEWLRLAGDAERVGET
ncbi:hypothetical protein [Nocardioides renjunii]|uniref:hypothetical protein n=1 Tax=Nocardioides renjunii TaxID=3095075 RepID=UPI002AFFED47|nr:hypothetical protein [Nocardioides sp. S-34]WQQ22936.1 hypothetical protein SHK17_02930 [Nocardioides sp. S-34]